MLYAGSVRAQAPGRFPPDSLINVKVIPKNMPVMQVVGMMRNFAGALGVCGCRSSRPTLCVTAGSARKSSAAADAANRTADCRDIFVLAPIRFYGAGLQACLRARV